MTYHIEDDPRRYQYPFWLTPEWHRFNGMRNAVEHWWSHMKGRKIS